eukprot:scaffold2835_cov105-Isochrysis_galbana.AAC.3
MGCHPDTGLGKKQTPFRGEQQKQNLARRLPPRSPLLLNSRCGREQVADRCGELADEWIGGHAAISSSLWWGGGLRWAARC